MLDTVLQPNGDVDFTEQLRTYIEDTLHQPVRLIQWKGATSLPVFLSRRFDFIMGTIAHQHCLFAVDRDTANATPKELSRQMAQIERDFDGIVIYAAQSLSADRRARLIVRGVPFAIPHNQLYIPQLAFDLRDYFRARPKPITEHISPVAQAVLFHHLLRLPQSDNRLQNSYSGMSVWRAYEELKQLDLMKVTKRGRCNWVELNADPRHLIDIARPYLRNPVRRQKHVDAGLISPHIMQAGESALATLTDLSPPPLPVYAVHYRDWSNLVEELDLREVEFVEDAATIIELWHYDPKILVLDGAVVDRLSLYAQFWNHPDERVTKAADALLEQVSW